MKVSYLLNGSALYGGVKVVYQHARILRRFGVDAEVLSPDAAPGWFPDAEAVHRQVPELAARYVGRTDFAVGTIYFTVPEAVAVGGAVPAHLCQCYEALWQGARDQRGRIDEIYRLPTLKLAVSPHLVEIIAQRTGQTATWIPQPFEPDLFSPPASERPQDGRLRVLLSGLWSLDIKGIEWGMRALRPLAQEGWLELVRLSQEVESAEEAFWPDAERHAQLPPARVPDLMRSVDVSLSLSDEVEGFGLPTLEAMGCGRATVSTDIAPMRALDPQAQASLRVPVRDAEALRAALRRLRADPALRQRLGAAGRSIASTFTEERTGIALVRVFEQALRDRAASSD